MILPTPEQKQFMDSRGYDLRITIHTMVEYTAIKLEEPNEETVIYFHRWLYSQSNENLFVFVENKLTPILKSEMSAYADFDKTTLFWLIH